MIVLHVAPVVWQAIGGPHVSIPALVSSQNDLAGIDAALAVTAPNPQRPPALPFAVFQQKLRLDAAGQLNLPVPFDRPHLVVFHSTYIPAHATIAARLRKASIPYIICPRGGMTRHAQQYRWWKKSVANLLFFNRMVAHAAAVNCLTEGEASASGGWGRPMFVVGNGTKLPAQSDLPLPRESACLRLVFIGRLHIPSKGLDMLLEACQLAQAELRHCGASLELYGPDCGGSTRILGRQIAKLRLQDVAALHGPLIGEAKASLLRETDVFVHPSRSEGHPSAVLEALAYGLPCLLTPGTNMADEVEAVGAGWKARPSPAGIADALKRIVHTDRNQLRLAGTRARHLAAEKYSWSEIAARSIEAYRKYAA